MQSEWTAKEKKVLEAKSRFLFDKPPSREMFPLSDFLEADTLIAFLEKEACRIGTNNKKVAASVLLKRYAFLAVGTLAAWSFFRKPLVFSAKNIWLVDCNKSEPWLPNFFIDTAAWDEGTGQIRNPLNHIGRVIESARKATDLSSLIMWENIAVYIFWLYEIVLKEEQFAHIRERATADFVWLLSPEQAGLFGDYQSNPLARYYKEKTPIKDREELLRIRTT